MYMKKLGFVFFLTVLFNIQCSSPKLTENSGQPVVPIKEQVKAGAFMVDVRTAAEFSEGSIPGAVNIPLNEVEARVKEFEGKPSVIVFCKSGNRSGKAKAILEDHGIKNVTNGINVSTMRKELK